MLGISSKTPRSRGRDEVGAFFLAGAAINFTTTTFAFRLSPQYQQHSINHTIRGFRTIDLIWSNEILARTVPSCDKVMRCSAPHVQSATTAPF
jgi:hypothetical protein